MKKSLFDRTLESNKEAMKPKSEFLKNPSSEPQQEDSGVELLNSDREMKNIFLALKDENLKDKKIIHEQDKQIV